MGRTDITEAGEEEETRVPFLKAYTVFNVEQIEGLPSRYHPEPAKAVNPDARIGAAEQFFAGCRAETRHGGGCAYYAPGPDIVQMPPFEAFRDAESYYATLGHEMVHWTRHPSRLDRDFGRSRFGDAGYACEELVAEIGSAFLCATLVSVWSRGRITPLIWRPGCRSCATINASSSRRPPMRSRRSPVCRACKTRRRQPDPERRLSASARTVRRQAGSGDRAAFQLSVSRLGSLTHCRRLRPIVYPSWPSA